MSCRDGIYRGIVEQSTDGIVIIDADGTILDCNIAACQITGIEASSWAGRTLVDFIGHLMPDRVRTPANLERLNETATAGFQQGFTPWFDRQLEVIIQRSDGSERVIQITTYPFQAGSVEKYCSIFRDITENRGILKALAESEEKFRALTETAPAAICIIQDGLFRYVNPAMENISGYTREELLSINFSDLIHPDMRDEIRVMCNDWIKGPGNEARFEIKGVSKRGIVGWIDISGKRIEYLGRPALLVSGIDVSMRKAAEEAMRNSEEKFRVLAETSAAAICLFQDQRFVYANPAVERISGYAKQDLIGKCIWDLVPDGFQDHLRRRMAQRTNGAAVSARFEMQFLAKNGEVRWIDVSRGQVNIGGTPLYMVSAFDITERKQYEERLTNAKAEAELYLDLIGHDINNMNQIAMGYLEMANNLLEIQGSLGRAHQFLIAKPIETLMNNSNLIRNVRKLQREKAGDYHLEPVEISKVLGDITAQFARVPGRDVNIRLETCHCTVIANDLLKDVFQNLIGNAIKHSAGPLEISVRAEQIGECGSNAWCRVSVEDNGPGIPDAAKKTLFDRFSLEKTRASGRGFGLYLSRLLIDDFGGRFRIEDRVPGDHTKGARFVVELPAAPKVESPS